MRRGHEFRRFCVLSATLRVMGSFPQYEWNDGSFMSVYPYTEQIYVFTPPARKAQTGNHIQNAG